MKKSDRNKNISFIICSNGFGHTKRCIDVIIQLNKIDKSIEYLLICNSSKNQYILDRLKSTQIVFNIQNNIMISEPDWLNLEKLTFKQFLKWAYAFKNNEHINKSDLVISDNYICPLLSKKKTVLMGSFLWSDVAEKSTDIKKIISFQNQLLNRFKPYIISLERLYMKSISEKIEVYTVNWFTERKNDVISRNLENILITPGGTRHLEDEFIQILKLLVLYTSNYTFYIDEKLYKRLGSIFLKKNLNVKKFNFTHKNFNIIDLFICRPGIGILTDSVSYLIPSIMIHDDKNLEIKNNAERMSSLKLGISLNIENIQLNNLILRITNFLSDTNYQKNIKKNLAKEKVNGHYQAAIKIYKEITNV